MKRRDTSLLLALVVLVAGPMAAASTLIDNPPVVEPGNHHSYISAYQGADIRDDQLAAHLFATIPNYRNMSFVLGTCYSGGFLNDLGTLNGNILNLAPANIRPNVSIAAAARWDRTSWGWVGGQTFFQDAWNGAVDAPHPANDSMLNAFQTARASATQKEISNGLSRSVPQYFSSGPAMDNLTLSAQLGDGKRYAILFGGIVNDSRFYNDAVELYGTLINDYGYTSGDIAVLWGDGTHQVDDRGAVWNAIDGPGTRQALWDTITDMGNQGGAYQPIGADDRLLVAAFDHGRQNSLAEIVGSLSNFDVHNSTGQVANDFHVMLGATAPQEIRGYYNGWGTPVSTVYDPIADTTEVIWTDGAVQPCEWVHFGVRFQGNHDPSDYEAWWTRDGAPVALEIPQVPQFWWPLENFGIRDDIVNLEADPVIVRRWFAVHECSAVPLDELNWAYVPPGGWTYLDETSLLPSEHLYFDFDTSGIPICHTYTVLMRYEVEWAGNPGEVVVRYVNAAWGHNTPEPVTAMSIFLGLSGLYGYIRRRIPPAS